MIAGTTIAFLVLAFACTFILYGLAVIGKKVPPADEWNEGVGCMSFFVGYAAVIMLAVALIADWVSKHVVIR